MIPLRALWITPLMYFYAFLDFMGITRADLFVIKVFLLGGTIGGLLTWYLT